MQAFIRYVRHHHLGMLALFVALGGTSYAAVKLPAKSVGTKQLKAGAVTGAKVRDHSLSAADFGGQLPAGASGAQGATGLPDPRATPAQPARPAQRATRACKGSRGPRASKGSRA